MNGDMIVSTALCGVSVSAFALAVFSAQDARLRAARKGDPGPRTGFRGRRGRVSRAYRANVAAEWPRFLEGLLVTLASGMHLPEALAAATRVVTGPLRSEMDRVILELRAGKPAYRCIGELSDRLAIPAISRFCSVLTQAEILGTSLADMCAVLTDEAYREMRQDMEHRLNALPVKLALVSCLLLLPPVVLVTVGPGVLRFLEGW